MPLVALTGATGFIGWHASLAFRRAGWRVRAIVRPESTRPVPDHVERIVAPLTSSEITAACKDVDLFVHMAAAVGLQPAEAFERSNVHATREVARACQVLGIPLIHTSSLGATGPGDPVDPPTEDSPTRPVNEYGRSKLASERVVKDANGLRWSILRPTLVYGPRDRLFLPLFKLASRGLFPVPQARAAYNLVHVDDVARCVVRVAESPAAIGETFFVGGADQLTARDLMARLATVFGKHFWPIPIPRAVLHVLAEAGTLASVVGLRMPINRSRWRELDASGFVCRTDKAERKLGFVATTNLVEGLRATAEWYRANGKL
jgi:nucleoside-diphosphate-sugar epimerase